MLQTASMASSSKKLKELQDQMEKQVSFVAPPTPSVIMHFEGVGSLAAQAHTMQPLHFNCITTLIVLFRAEILRAHSRQALLHRRGSRRAMKCLSKALAHFKWMPVIETGF